MTLRTFDCEISSQSIPASWSALKKLSSPFKALDIEAVYEAGYFGYWLYRHLSQWGVCCRVTPPSLIPLASGHRVKTDRKDSKKLAFYLSRGMFKSIFILRKNVTIQVSEKPVQLNIIKKIPGEDRSFSSPSTILFH